MPQRQATMILNVNLKSRQEVEEEEESPIQRLGEIDKSSKINSN